MDLVRSVWHIVYVVVFDFLLFSFIVCYFCSFFFFFQAEDGIRDWSVTGVQTCALPISRLAEQQHGLRQPRVLGILRDEPFQRAARGGIQAVRERALADEPQAIRLLDGSGGRHEEHGEQHEREAGGDTRRAALHAPSVARLWYGSSVRLCVF